MSRETYTTKVVEHTWTVDTEFYSGARWEVCTKCEASRSYEPGEGFTEQGEPHTDVCTVEVQKCICEKSHSRGHSKCFEAGEHVCGPCECDCHYSQE
jgi:hypothetical protein